MKNIPIKYDSTRFLTFTPNGGEGLEVRFESNTIWLTQKLMSELFDVDVRTVNEHLKNIFISGELDEISVIRNFRITASDGKQYLTKHYNLDAIISVGYRVNSMRATQFRQWATSILTKFTLQGYVIDKQRMEQGEIFGEDYFEQLLAEIREIRLSERRFYEKVTDIFATSTDYDRNSPQARTFFAQVQNKLHYAVHQQTAAEIIHTRANATKPHMGLTSWRNAPEGKILSTDVKTAKNYLTQSELEDLARLVDTYLNLAESRAKRRIPTTMNEWAKHLDEVLRLDERELLEHAGKVSAKQAEKHALEQYKEFRVMQDRDYKSDFDKFVEEAQ